MSRIPDIYKYDEVLTSILVNEKSILGFLSTIFNFLARRTDFYHVPDGPYENMGFPPGVAEELVVKVLRTCDPKNFKAPNGAIKSTDVNDEIMCSTVAQEVEVIADEDLEENNTLEAEDTPVNTHTSNPVIEPSATFGTVKHDKQQSEPAVNASIAHMESKIQELSLQESPKTIPEDYKPPMLPTQKNSETYNGADREHYLWSQTIMELDVTVKLPPDIKSAKDLKVTLNTGDISILRKNGDIILKDSLPYKIKAIDSFWSVSEGKLIMHLEKVQERWWNKLLNNEEPIDLDRIDCSRPLDDLPEDQVAKVRELQWNQERKLQGLPTSDDIRNINILKKAWNAPGSPFQGQKFNPNILNSSNTLPSFSGDQ
ncbi:unnamed protein product [Arctia plantaginis]|uniref:Nuclear migration protein nudC n=1 Tax=Arctia plantaginis TaxID=874455 RepID=A0A8S1B7F7_ARCPL|nr:unnamed protein product [Arctia plantaginis]